MNLDRLKLHCTEGGCAVACHQIQVFARVSNSGAHYNALRQASVKVAGVRARLIYLNKACAWVESLPTHARHADQRAALLECLRSMTADAQRAKASSRAPEPEVEICEPEADERPQETPKTLARAIPRIESQGLVEVSFAGSSLAACLGGDGEVYTSVRRMCENLGIDPKSQRAKLKRASNAHWARGVIITSHDTAGREQDHFMIAARCVPMWMSRINPLKLPTEQARAAVRHYQEKVADVLAAHFTPEVAKSSTTDLALQQTLAAVSQLAQSTTVIMETLQAQSARQETQGEQIKAMQEKLAGGAPSERTRHTPNALAQRFIWRTQVKEIIEHASLRESKQNTATALDDIIGRNFGRAYQNLEYASASRGHYWSVEEVRSRNKAQQRANGRQYAKPILTTIEEEGPINLLHAIVCKMFPRSTQALNHTPAPLGPRLSVVDGGK
jgi:hypothetical protein